MFVVYMKSLLSKITRPTLTFFLGILVATVVTTVLAHGGDTSLTHSCIKTSNGSVRIVGANDTCASNETPLDWPKTAGNNGLPFICLSCGYFDSTGRNVLAEFLAGKNLTGAMLPASGLGSDDYSVNMSGTNFTSAYLDSLSVGQFGANFTNINFTGATISNIQFLKTNLSMTNFTNSNLSSSSFTNANLTGATGIDTANLTGVTWSDTTCPDGTNSDSHGNTCVGHLTP